MVGAGHTFIEVHHEVLGKPKLTANLLRQDITAITYDPETGQRIEQHFILYIYSEMTRIHFSTVSIFRNTAIIFVGTILASDQLRNVIFRYDPKTGEIVNLITTKIGQVGGMDYDFLGRNLYWCDTKFNNIEIYSLNTGERAILNAKRLEDVPLNLAVIPEYG